ncbi:MAG: iron-containing alcohol dehydrogenase [Flavobacteriales bacterium]|jgi:alcohol dehydrogenase class IV|tara:strand:+ start:1517 stop:2659 length:1143 start_codon:yes stop_codon:yes gene_type:complete
MKTITLLHPGKLVFGDEALEVFKNDFIASGYKRLFILTIPFLIDHLSELLETFKGKSIEYELDMSILNEPSFQEFNVVLEKAKSFEADSIVGIGGGSVLDVSKLVAAQLKNTQTIDEIIGIGNLRERQTYLACIPSTSGTGSEVSPNAIFIDENGGKKGVISPFLVPDASYIYPKLTLSVPASITAATGIDALTHCLEAYANKFSHPVVDVIAIEGIKLIAENLVEACENGNDLEARTNVALGSLYGGMCLGPVNTGAVHALSYPLGTEFHIPHGLSNALLLPYVMEFNLPKAIIEYANIAKVLGAEIGHTDEETAKNGILKIRELNAACKIPSKLSDLGIPITAIDKMANNALEIHRLLKNNPKKVELEDAKTIYKAAF